jgi:hypothetical protein
MPTLATMLSLFVKHFNKSPISCTAWLMHTLFACLVDLADRTESASLLTSLSVSRSVVTAVSLFAKSALLADDCWLKVS